VRVVELNGKRDTQLTHGINDDVACRTDWE
jgi:hypothetical protein